MRIYNGNSCGVEKVLLIEGLAIFVIGMIITVVYMLLSNDSIIENDWYRFAHRHTWVCYILWAPWNGTMLALIWEGIMFLTGFPLFYNIYVAISNLFAQVKDRKAVQKKKKESKKDLMREFLNYRRTEV